MKLEGEPTWDQLRRGLGHLPKDLIGDGEIPKSCRQGERTPATEPLSRGRRHSHSSYLSVSRKHR